MMMLSPADDAVTNGQFRTDLKDLSQTVTNESTLRGIMDICLHHERVGSQFLDRLRINLMSFRNEQKADPIDRLRAQPTHVVTNRSP